jgi:hypothetical protein
MDLAPADLHVCYFSRGEAQDASGNLAAAYRLSQGSETVA